MVLALAISAIASTSASAEAPEWGRCVKQVAVEKVFHGKYSNAKCTLLVTPEEEAAKGKFEWFPGAVAGKNHFTTTGGPLDLRSTLRLSGIKCTSEKGQGEYSLTNSKQLANVVLEFAGCTNGTFKCTTEGQSSGVIIFNELVGEVGYQKMGKATALKLAPGPSAGGKFIVFFCIGSEYRYRGKGEEAGAGVLVNIKSGSMKATETLKFVASKKHIQKPVVWEGFPTETYPELSEEHLPYEQTGWTNEMTITNDEEMKYELNLLV
jgi:hypothetical protein